MKPLLIALVFSAGLWLSPRKQEGGLVIHISNSFNGSKTKPIGPLVVRSPKGVGPCEPYAEVCRHCSDCSTCKHCSKDGGRCSVCFKR